MQAKGSENREQNKKERNGSTPTHPPTHVHVHIHIHTHIHMLTLHTYSFRQGCSVLESTTVVCTSSCRNDSERADRPWWVPPWPTAPIHSVRQAVSSSSSWLLVFFCGLDFVTGFHAEVRHIQNEAPPPDAEQASHRC